ncbi:hypothetical protein Anas_14080, partial [Armadillidium nasatum]
MEYFFSCEICNFEYDSDRVIPKSLCCGHTFCSSCLTSIIENNPVCPLCWKAIKNEEFSINYSLLGIVEMRKSLKCLESSDLSRDISILKKKFYDQKEVLSKCKSQIMNGLENIDEGLRKLQTLDDLDKTEINFVKMRKEVNHLQELYRKVDEGVSLFLKIQQNFVNLSLNQFQSGNDFLLEIYRKLERNEKVCGVSRIKDCLKFNEAFQRDNMIFFNSFSLSEPPKNATVILFEELKQCIMNRNFNAFLKVSCNSTNIIHTIIIEMFNTLESSNFIKLCTGECGPSYKNSLYNKGIPPPPSTPRVTRVINQMYVLLSVENSQTDAMKEIRAVEYFTAENDYTVSARMNDIFVRGSRNGAFTIEKVNTDSSVQAIVNTSIRPLIMIYS